MNSYYEEVSSARSHIEEFLKWCREYNYALCEESNDSESSQFYNLPLIKEEKIVDEYIHYLKYMGRREAET